MAAKAVKSEMFGVATCDQNDLSTIYQILYLPRQGKPAKNKETCVICFDGIDSDLMFYVVRCGHRFCCNCVKQHIEAKLLDQKLPNCLHHRCKAKLSIDSCGELLTHKLSLMWEERIEEFSIPYTERVYCPRQNCSHVMSKTELSRFKSAHDPYGLKRCFKCRGFFCVNCNVPWHYMLSCKDYKKLSHPNSNNDAKLKYLANLYGWRQCPKCQHMVERIYGCNRIVCRCGKAFCYKCGSEWNDMWLHADGDCNFWYGNGYLLATLGVFVVLSLLVGFVITYISR